MALSTLLQMQTTSPFDSLPDELLLQIMLHCAPSALLNGEAVCRRWRSLLQSGGAAAWLSNTECLWKATGWTHNVSPAIPLMDRIRKVPVGVMRRVLADYDTAGLAEKSEWMRLLRVKLLWGNVSHFFTRNSRGKVAPQWALEVDDCKAAWHFAVIEIARDVPFEAEVVRQHWDLIYNENPDGVFDMIFSANHTMTCTSHPGATFRWWIQPWRDLSPPGLQIENFPLHRFSRRRDGLWMARNAYVSIIQRSPPPGDVMLFDESL